MDAVVIKPSEKLPELGTVENPVVFFDGEDAFVSYEVSRRRGGGIAVIAFRDVTEFRVTPMNVEGLRQCRYPINAWEFNEIINAEETAGWIASKPRYWFISFNDVTIEVIFGHVTLMVHDIVGTSRQQVLLRILN